MPHDEKDAYMQELHEFCYQAIGGACKAAPEEAKMGAGKRRRPGVLLLDWPCPLAL